MNMDEMLQKLMEQLKPGYAIIVKLGDTLEEKENTPINKDSGKEYTGMDKDMAAAREINPAVGGSGESY